MESRPVARKSIKGGIAIGNPNFKHCGMKQGREKMRGTHSLAFQKTPFVKYE